MIPLRNIIFALLLLLASTKKVSSLVELQLPQVPTDGISDPDRIFTESQHQRLAQRIADFQIYLSTGGDEKTEVQIAIAVVDRMTVPLNDMDQEDAIAEHYARSLHDAWGVGQTTEAGGTGVLLFLSIYDRIVYISRGGAMTRVLTDSRIDSIIQKMRPAMRQTLFADGLQLAIDEIEGYILKGEISWTEWLLDLFSFESFVFLTVVAAMIKSLIQTRRELRQQREYAQAASQLSEIDRAHAEALQGRFQATSCPICLETFKDSHTGSDGLPIRLLRCGHAFDETCWNQWISSGLGNIRQCPICKMDLGASPSPLPVREEQTTVAHTHHHDHHHDHHLDESTNENETSIVQNEGNDQAAVALRRFQQDRNFRLVQLGVRFPRIITPSEIQRWSSPNYDGSLVRDPIFRQHSPEEIAARQQQQRQQQEQTYRSQSTSSGGGFSHSSMSYGGGTSSGGRSGRF